MEGLLDDLQDLLDSHGDPSLEVEYHVRQFPTALYAYVLIVPAPPHVEWGPHPRSRSAWHVCDQQTTTQ
jgi:hypothetical protein